VSRKARCELVNIYFSPVQAFRERNVPTVGIDYSVEATTLPDTYLCPHALASSFSYIPIGPIYVSCQVLTTNSTVTGERARNLYAFKSGQMKWGSGSVRTSPTYFTHWSKSDCEVASSNPLYSPIFEANGSYTCFWFNTSKFLYEPALIDTGFAGVQVSVWWNVRTNSSLLLDGYTGGGNLMLSDSGDAFEKQVAGNSILRGYSTIVLFLARRSYLDGSVVSALVKILHVHCLLQSTYPHIGLASNSSTLREGSILYPSSCLCF
jgi:hypothetical protein